MGIPTAHKTNLRIPLCERVFLRETKVVTKHSYSLQESLEFYMITKVITIPCTEIFRSWHSESYVATYWYSIAIGVADCDDYALALLPDCCTKVFMFLSEYEAKCIQTAYFQVQFCYVHIWWLWTLHHLIKTCYEFQLSWFQSVVLKSEFYMKDTGFFPSVRQVLYRQAKIWVWNKNST